MPSLWYVPGMNTLKVVDRSEVAARLRTAREALGLRQADAGAQVGKPPQLVSQWEAGAVPEGAVDVTRLGVVLGLTPNELYLEDPTARLRGQAKGLLPASEEPAAMALLVELAELTKLAGPGLVELFRHHAAGLRESFAAQLEGRTPWPEESAGALPTREEVQRLEADLLAFATKGFAESPHAQRALDVAKRLGLLSDLLPRQEGAADTAAAPAAGRSPKAPVAASPERAAGPRKRPQPTPRKKK